MNGLPIFIISGLISFGVTGGETEHWRGWDNYQAIMWSTGEPKDQTLWFERLREMGCTAEECYRGKDSTPFVRSDFGFYVENLVPQLAYLHSRRKLYDEDFQGYTTTRDKKFLVRSPCLHDPDFWQEIKDYLQDLVRPHVANQPLLYNLQDELSIGSFASPMDYCFGAHTLLAFRQWLQEQYHSLDALNQEWETGFISWDEVVPMTTYEIKERERDALASGKLENYSPWADHRQFMDISFAQALSRLRDLIREIDPNVPVGIEGTQMASAWGGYDLWQLAKVIDWVEAYDIANSHEIFRSFLPPHAPVLSTVFGSEFQRIRQYLWWSLLQGDRGCVIWDDEESRCIEKTEDNLPLTERGKSLEPIFSELRDIAPLIFQLQRIDDRIAIHYSQASIRAHWMFDSRADGDTWPRRFSSYEAKHSRYAHVRDSFVRIIEDLGLQYNFVSYEQIEQGELLESGYKILLLPQSVAMSQKECEQIKEFVQAGGIIIADNMTATMDKHCKRLPVGQLDELFGIRRNSADWKQKAETISLPTTFQETEPLQVYESEIAVTSGKALYTVEDVSAVIENQVGKGCAIYLNLDMHDYGKYRLTPPKGKEYQELFHQLFQEAGVETIVKVLSATDNQSATCVEVWRYRGKDADYIALMRNPEFDAGSFSNIGYPDNAELESSETVQIILPEEKHVTDVRTGEEFGVTNKVTVELEPWSPIILGLR